MRYFKRKNTYIKTSKLEKRFASLLREMGIKYKRQYKVDTKYYDFYVPAYNLLIEVDGDWYHGNPRKVMHKSKMHLENRMNDIYKNGLAAAHGFKLLRFWECDIRNNPHAVRLQLLNFIYNQKKK